MSMTGVSKPLEGKWLCQDDLSQSSSTVQQSDNHLKALLASKLKAFLLPPWLPYSA